MDYKESIKELKSIVLFSEALFKDLNTESKSASYITMMGLFAALIEHSSSFLILMENKSFSSTQTLARTAFEVYVDILNLEKDGNYSNYLWAEYYNREKELNKSGSIKKLLKTKRDECFKLYDKKSDFEVFTVSQKFNLANFKAEYKSIYSLLSAHTHSGIFSLFNRIIEDGEVNKLSQQGLFKSKPSEIEILSIPLICNCLLDACEIVAKGHDPESLEFVNKLRTLLFSRSS